MSTDYEQNAVVYKDASVCAELDRRIDVLADAIAKRGEKVPSRDELRTRVFKSDRSLHERWRREGRAG
jgi:hypothetical protein